MTDHLSIGQLYPGSLHPLTRTQRTVPSAQPATAAVRQHFADMLRDNLVRLSHHAEERLQQRGIDLSEEQLEKIRSAIDKAERKGAKESLMLMNDLALIVNVKNKTVVTAMDTKAIDDHVFTQIDSAVIIR